MEDLPKEEMGPFSTKSESWTWSREVVFCVQLLVFFCVQLLAVFPVTSDVSYTARETSLVKDVSRRSPDYLPLSFRSRLSSSTVNTCNEWLGGRFKLLQLPLDNDWEKKSLNDHCGSQFDHCRVHKGSV